MFIYWSLYNNQFQTNLSLNHVAAILAKFNGHAEDVDAVVVFDVLQKVIHADKGSRATYAGAVGVKWAWLNGGRGGFKGSG